MQSKLSEFLMRNTNRIINNSNCTVATFDCEKAPNEDEVHVLWFVCKFKVSVVMRIPLIHTHTHAHKVGICTKATKYKFNNYFLVVKRKLIGMRCKWITNKIKVTLTCRRKRSTICIRHETVFNAEVQINEQPKTIVRRKKK